MRRKDHGANDRIQPGSVTAPGRDGNAHRSLSALQPLDGLADFAGRSVAMGSLLGKDQLSVHRDFEESARCLHQANVHLGKSLLQLSGQTGSSGLIVSNHTVLNGDLHFRVPSHRESQTAANRSVAMTGCQGECAL